MEVAPPDCVVSRDSGLYNDSTTKGNQMNKYTGMMALKRLVAAEVVIEKLSNEQKYRDAMTVSEFVKLKMAVELARALIEEDLVSRVAN